MKTLVAMLLTSISVSSIAHAQTTDVVVMRRAIAPPQRQAAPAPTPTPDVPTTIPTPGVGVPAPTPSPTPVPTPASPIAGVWDPGGWGFPSNAPVCSASTTQVRIVTCRETVGGAVIDEGHCDPATKPIASRTVERTDGCRYDWQPGSYTTYDSTCSDAARRTELRAPTCLRSDLTQVDVSFCDPAQRPPAALVAPRYEGCTIDWAVGQYGNYASTCSAATQTRTRSVTCQRTGGTSQPADQPDELCTKPKPATTSDPAVVTSGCTYAALGWTAYTPETACSSSATKTSTATICRRSDQTDVPLDECTTNGVPITQSVTAPDYTGCTYSVTSWSPYSPSSGCGTNMTQVRNAYTCERSDKQSVSVDVCQKNGVEIYQSRYFTDFSACSYTPTYSCTATGGTASLAKCMRSDGTDVTTANADGGYKNCAATSPQTCTVATIPNGDMEANASWTMTANGSGNGAGYANYGGSRVMALNALNKDYGGYGSQDISLQANTSYTITYSIAVANAANCSIGSITVFNGPTPMARDNGTVCSTSFIQRSVTFNTGSLKSATVRFIGQGSTSSPSIMYVDNVSIRAN